MSNLQVPQGSESSAPIQSSEASDVEGKAASSPNRSRLERRRQQLVDSVPTEAISSEKEAPNFDDPVQQQEGASALESEPVIEEQPSFAEDMSQPGVSDTESEYVEESLVDDERAMIEDLRQSLGLSGLGADPAVAPKETEDKEPSWFERADSFLARYGPLAPLDARTGSGELVSEVTKGLIKGAMATVEQLGNFAVDTAMEMEDFLHSKYGVGTGDLVTEEARMDFVKSIFPEESIPMQISRSVTQYGLAFIPAYSVFRGAKGLTKAGQFLGGSLGASALSYMAIDPEEERLATLLYQVPQLRSPILEYMAGSENDTRAESRFKNSVESLVFDGVMGLAGRALYAGIKGAKQVRKARIEKHVADEIVANAEKNPDLVSGRMGKYQKMHDEYFVNGKDILEVPDGESILRQNERVNEFLRRTEVPEVAEELAKFNRASTLGEMKEALRNHAKSAPGGGKPDPELIIQTARRFTIPDKQHAKNVARVMKDVEKLEGIRNRTPGQMFSPEENTAADVLLGRDLVELDNFVRSLKGKKSTPEDLVFLDKLYHQAVESYGTAAGIRAEWGRTGRNTRLGLEFGGDPVRTFKRLQEEMRAAGGQDSTEEMLTLLQKMSEKDLSMVDMLKHVHESKSLGKWLGNAMGESYINGILAAPKTHDRNMLTSLGVVMVNIAETAFARTVGRLAVDKQYVAPGEVSAATQGMYTGLQESIGAMGKMWRGDELPRHLMNIDNKTKAPRKSTRVISAQGLYDQAGYDIRGTTYGKILNSIGAVFNGPLSAIQLEDTFVRGIAYRSKAMQLASRRAHKAGLLPGTKEYNEFMEEMMKNPPPGIDMGADQFATGAVFATEINDMMFGGKFFKATQNLAKSLPPGISRIAVPFSRALAGIVDFGVQRTPVLSHLSPQFQADMAAGGYRRQMAVGRVAFGSTVMMTGGGLSLAGFYQGGLPSHPQSRRAITRGNQGFQENAFITPSGKYINTGRIDPFASMLSFGADMSTIAANLYDPGDVDAHVALGDALTNATAATAKFVTPGMVDNAADVFGFIQDVKEGNIGGRDLERMAAKAVVGVAVPWANMWRELRRAQDPTKRRLDTDYPDAPALTRVLDTIKKDFLYTFPVPGWTEGLPPHRNMFFDPIVFPAGLGADIAVPFEVTLPEESVFVREAERLGMFESSLYSPKKGETLLRFDMPPKVVQRYEQGQRFSVRLTPKEYDRYVELSAGIGLEASGGQTLREALEDEVGQSWYKEMTDQEKRVRLKEIVSEYRKAGMEQFESEQDDFFRRMQNQRDLINKARGGF